MMNAALFLNPEPPKHNHRLLVDLFEDREEELRQARQQIADVRAAGIRKPMAVVGAARTGKSHLMLLLASQVERDFDATIRLEISTGLTDARDVLREAFRQARVMLGRQVEEHGLGRAGGPYVFEALDDLARVYGPAIDGYASEVEISRAREVTTGGKLSLELGSLLPALLPSLSAETESSETRSAGSTIKVPAFEAPQLTDLIALCHSLVRDLSSGRWTTLLVVDDFDLLKRERSGAFDPDPLMQALANLARVEGLFVLTTIREDSYHRHEKTFHQCCAVHPFDTDEPLLEIYRRHVRLLHDGVDPFRGRWVEEVAPRCEGRVGVFLKWLREIFMDLPSVGSKANLREVLDVWWTRARRDDRELADQLLSMIRSAGGEIRPELNERLRLSALRRYLLEDVTSQDRLSFDPVLLSHLRLGLARPEPSGDD